MRGYSRVRVIPRQVITHSRARTAMLLSSGAGARRAALPNTTALRVTSLCNNDVISQLLRQLPRELQDD
jgi:hypothetical protein